MEGDSLEPKRQGIFRGHPAGNYFILCILSVSYAAQVIWDPRGQWIHPLILRGWTWTGMLGYLWIHTDIIHILESIVTLWIFGRFVADCMPAVTYVLSFFLLGIMAAVTHLLFDGRPAVGASGAIMGILGMHMVLCGNRGGTFEPFLALAWFIISLVMGIAHIGLAAHMAHIGGFSAGLVLAVILALTGQAHSDDMSPLLLAWLSKAKLVTVTETA